MDLQGQDLTLNVFPLISNRYVIAKSGNLLGISEPAPDDQFSSCIAANSPNNFLETVAAETIQIQVLEGWRSLVTLYTKISMIEGFSLLALN